MLSQSLYVADNELPNHRRGTVTEQINNWHSCPQRAAAHIKMHMRHHHKNSPIHSQLIIILRRTRVCPSGTALTTPLWLGDLDHPGPLFEEGHATMSWTEEWRANPSDITTALRPSECLLRALHTTACTGSCYNIPSTNECSFNAVVVEGCKSWPLCVVLRLILGLIRTLQ